MYVREKATDGERYADLTLPEFEARDLDGNAVRSADLVGKPTILTVLAGHCSHSFDTLPILQQLERTYESMGVRVVGMYVNSGSVDDINGWIDHYEPEYEVWVHPEDSIGDVVNSHLVPTYLLLDAEGKVQEKLVGYKSLEEVEARVSELIASSPQTG